MSYLALKEVITWTSLLHIPVLATSLEVQSNGATCGLGWVSLSADMEASGPDFNCKCDVAGSSVGQEGPTQRRDISQLRCDDVTRDLRVWSDKFARLN